MSRGGYVAFLLYVAAGVGLVGVVLWHMLTNLNYLIP